MAEKSSSAALTRYGVALLSAAAGLGLRLGLAGVLGETVPFLTLFPAVMFAAWFGGLGPGLLAMALCLGGAFWLFIPVPFTPADAVRALFFAGFSVFISVLIEGTRRSRARSEQAVEELRRVERELAEAKCAAERDRDLLLTTLASIGDAVITTDAASKVTFLNEVATDLTGWSQDEASGKPIEEVFRIWNEKSKLPAENPVERVIREGVVVNLANHTVLTARDGRDIPIEDSAAPIRDEKQGILGVVLVFRDVTERKKAEDALLSQWLTFDTALSNTPDFNYIFDLEGRFRYVNRARLLMFQKSLEEVLGKSFYDLPYPKELADRFHRQIQHVIDTRETVRDQAPYTGPTGVTRQYEYIFVPVVSEDGKVEAVVGTTHDITEQKLVEESLRVSQERLRAIFDGTYTYTGLLAPDGVLLEANRASLEFAHNGREDVVGRLFWETPWFTATPGAPERVKEGIARAAAGESVRFEATLARPSGESPTFDISLHPVRNERGEVALIVPEGRDITERKRAEESIIADRRRWRELLLHSPVAIAVLRGPQHSYEWVNLEYVRLVGRAAEELLGKPVLEAIPEIGGQAFAGILDRVFKTGETFRGHEARLHLDPGESESKDVYVNFLYLATRDEKGEIDGIFVHASDVTDMVLARQRIEESERQFRTLAESIPHLAWMADETGHIFWYNRRWYSYTGTTFEEMEGWGWQKVHDPEVLPEVLSQWAHAIATGNSFHMVFPLRGADGELRPFLTRVEPVVDSQGRVVRWFGTNTDVTEQRRTEEDLRRMNRELEEFAYVASHDLQEPLRMVNIYTQLIVDDPRAGAGELGNYSDFVRQGVRRMEGLIHDLLMFSRTVHSDEPPVGTADLQAALSEALAVLKNRVDESGSAIEAGSLPKVRGDTAQMAHVFQNLISNALKYRKAGQAAKIQISSHREGNVWSITVRDHGIGFEPQYAERIFGLFKRLHKEEYPGTGLGLAICKRIVERYGGRIWAEGRPAEGAVFRFTLPGVD